MGGGASKNKDKVGAAQLKKAQESEQDATTLFGKIDKNKDGKLSVGELGEAVKNYGKDVKAVWSDAVIADVIKFFDRDGDGMLDLAEFIDVMKELKERGSIDASLKQRAAAAAEAAKKQEEFKVIFDKYAKEGGVWDRGSTGKLIRELNEEGYWDDFGTEVTAKHAAITESESRKATATFEQFMGWYPKLMAEVEAIKKKWADDDAAQKAAKAAEAANEFALDKAEWTVPMKRLPVAIEAAWKGGKTPLLVDMTTPKGENKSAGFSPLETYFSYSGDTVVELKKAVVEVSVKKEKTLDEVRDEFAKKLLIALKQGRPLALLCSNSAPPMQSKYVCERFPEAMFNAAKVAEVVGVDNANKLDAPDSIFAGVLKFMKEHKDESGKPLQANASFNLTLVHDEFRVLVMTKFDPEDYKGFLEGEFPLDLMQPVKVFNPDD